LTHNAQAEAAQTPAQTLSLLPTPPREETMHKIPTLSARRSAARRLIRHASAIGTALALCIAGNAQAQDKPVAIKLSTWVPAQHPLNPSLTAWAADITKASGGTITAALFPSEQLGKAFDHYDMAKDGIADFAWISPGYQPGRFPVIAGAGLPFVFANAKGGSAAIDAWYRQYAAKEMKDVKFCFAFVHDPGTFHSKKKLLSPNDVKGLKVRPATGTIGQMVSLLGGTNVQASAPEAREALERGVADAITFPWGSILLFGIDKAVNEHMDVPLYTTPFVWVMNKDKYEAMTAAQKKVIDDHCTTEWAEKVATPWAEFESSGRTKLAAQAGHDAYKLTPEQLDAWRKAVAPTEVQWADGAAKAGYDPKQVMDSLKASLAKYKSGL
jgi:TRAP-type C4-dicarboxylate transport system substrate-binding protein